MKITRIAKQERRDRYNVFVDDAFFCALSAELLLESGIAEGDELQPGQLDSFISQDEAGKAVSKALSYVARRPHSEAVLRDKLKQKFDEGFVDDAIQRLNQLGYLDDEAFARQWVEERGTARGKRLLQQELRRKGVADGVIELVLDDTDTDEVAQARALAAKRLSRLSGHSPEVVRRRMTDYLLRRGYSYQVVNEVLADEASVRTS